MMWLPLLWSRVLGLVRPDRVEERIDEEMRTHLEFLEEEHLRAGMSPAEARRAALLSFGGVTGLKEECRVQTGAPVVEALWQDLRYGLRSLAKSRVFTASAVLTLTLGMGGAVAVFSLLQAVVLRGLPYPEAGRLVELREVSARAGVMSASWHDFLDWRAQAKGFSHLAAIKPGSVSLSGDGPAERLPALRVSAGFFPLLGVRPAAGRGFTDLDDRPGVEPVVVLSHAVWMSRFGGSAAVVGRRLVVDGVAHTVVGVFPAGFRFALEADVFQPIGAERMGVRGTDHGCYVFGRLAAGVRLEQARTEMTAIAAGLGRQYPQSNDGVTVQLEPLTAADARLGRTLWMLLGAVACLLLIACVNVCGLLLARGEARWREMQIRLALGASRRRILQQVLVEGALLAGLGAATAVGLAGMSLELLRGLVPEETLRVVDLRIDGPVMAAVVVLVFVATLAIAAVPAWLAGRGTGLGTLRGGDRTVTAGFRGVSFRGVLVAAEVGASFVLLAGSGLLFRSVMNVYRVDPGFRAERLLTAATALPRVRYEGKDDQVRFFDKLLAQVRATPGVEGAASAFCLPLNGGCWASMMIVEGQPAVPRKDLPLVDVNEVSPGYFRTLGVPLLQGRDFVERDSTATQPVAVVSEALVRRYFPDGTALGKRIKLAWPESPDPYFTIVGVVGDLRRFSLTEGARPEAYRCVRQFGSDVAHLVVRTRQRDAMALVEPVIRAARVADSDVPLSEFRPIEYFVHQSTESRQLPLTVVGVFAVLALAMAAVGLYGIVSYTVSSRTREVGIRLAIGASRADILHLVLGQGLKLAGVGLAIGLAGTMALVRVLRNLLFGVEPADGVTLILTAAILTGTLGFAAWLPARRASRTDPATSLRAE